MRRLLAVLVTLPILAPAAAQDHGAFEAHRQLLDQVLDLYVRDGMVYYRALKSDRAKLDEYVAWLADAPVDAAGRDEQLAFWLNAYDALVLRTVIDHYPIVRRSREYPDRSIRQIPGAFERLTHRVARRQVTLDEIETKILASFKDPRVYFAIGRGAVGGGRLRSEAFAPARLESQLAAVAAECVSRPQCVAVDRTSNRVEASAIFSWRADDFIAAYAGAAHERYASRSPIERAILAYIEPHLLTVERELLARNEFSVAFKPLDWTLNDLTGRGGR